MKESLFTVWQRIQTNVITVIWWVVVLIPVYLQWRSNKSSKLEFIELWKWEAVDTHQKWFKQKLEISYWDQKVSKLSTYTFRLKNIWSKVIDKVDFIDEKWVELFLNHNDQKLALNIIWYEIVDVSSSLLERSLEFDYFLHWFWIKPFVLNSWEYFTVRVVVDGEIVSWYLETRIKETSLVRSNFRKKIFFAFISIFFLLVIYTIFDAVNKKIVWYKVSDPQNYANDFFRYAIFILPVIVLIIYVWLFVTVIRIKWLSKFVSGLWYKDLFKKFWW